MAKTEWPKVGRLACLLGLLMSVGVVLEMGWTLVNRPDIDCAEPGVKPPTDPKAVVFAPEGQTLTVNGRVCIAVRTKSYFAGADSNPVAPAAQAPAAQLATDPPPVAPTSAAEAEASETLALFIDDHRTPIKFVVPRRAADEWTWKVVPLPAVDDAGHDDAGDWRTILAGSTYNGERTVKIGVGSAEAELPRASAGEATLRVYKPCRVWAIGSGLVLVVGGAIMWGWRTGMLRDRPPSDAEPTPPFSLGRSQMAFWFVLTLAGFLYIWLVTGQSLNVFTEDALILLGVSGATGLAAMTIGEGDEPPKPAVSKGYWTDILSVNGDIAIHRLQMVAWTLVLGLLFAWSVLSAYQFKSFGTTLLLLSGIAGATYVGFKTRESPAAPAQGQQGQDQGQQGQGAGADSQSGAAG